MYRITIAIILLIGIMVLPGKEAFAVSSLQTEINNIPKGGTLHVKAGRYYERIVLNKPLHLIGEKGTTLINCSSKPAITMKGKNISISGIRIETCEKHPKVPAIYISGRNHRLDGVQIKSGGVGVKLKNAENVSLTNMKVVGTGHERGFDLWQSHHNLFKGIRLNHVQDGFYMENSHYNRFIGNKVSNSRYGVHVMFSDWITIKKNVSVRNITGAMVMATHHTIIQNNRLADNNLNVNAQGLLLYDVHQSSIKGNLIENNRVGIYMDESSENKLIQNQINDNFIGLQLNKIRNNVLEHNAFVGNVTEMQANSRDHNRICENYWEAAGKLDSDGDGLSNLPYRADPYFLNLISETPEYQLFFQHPGMVLLQKMLKSPEQVTITDESPLMYNRLTEISRKKDTEQASWTMSTGMIAASLLLIYVGRKKR